MKAVTHPRATKVGVPLPLQCRHAGLCVDGIQVKHGVAVIVFTQYVGGGNVLQRVERNDHRLCKRNRLQLVDQVMKADLGRGLPGRQARVASGRDRVLRATLVVPRRPGLGVAWQHRSVSVQDCFVGVVADRTQGLPLGGARVREQCQRLVGVRGHHHFVERLFAAIGDDRYAIEFAGGMAVNAPHGGVQAFVGNTCNDFFNVMACAPGDCPPLGPVAHLNQAVVVTKPDHRRHGKLQHLIQRATPDATNHGQEVPVPKLGREVVAAQKLVQRLHQLSVLARFGQLGGHGVEPQHITQHGDEAPVHQVAPLGKHGVQAGAAPLQRLPASPARGGFDRKRHVGFGGFHFQITQQLDQVGVSALVEHQKSGVHAVCDRPCGRGQGDVHRMRVPAKVIPRLK